MPHRHNALTIDLEDWYHPELVRGAVGHVEGSSQIEHSTSMLLSLLREREVQATFFVVGEVAQSQPGLIADILEDGHELGCHGFSHRPLWALTPDEFRSELSMFLSVVDRVAPGTEVVGFRAPTFSLDNRTRWMLPILVEHGFRYDSSLFPLRTPLYGVNGGPLEPYRVSLQDITAADRGGVLVEFPMTVWQWGPLRVPVCGGAYLRILPFRFVRACLRRIDKARPLVVYVHPWEVFQHTPRLALPALSRLVTYHNLGQMKSRLTALLDEFRFATMKKVLEATGVWDR